MAHNSSTEPFWLKIKFQLHDDRLFLFGIEIAQ